MTARDKMIEKLANIIARSKDVWDSDTETAAAVLELVGPKKLVWVYPSDGSAHDIDCRYEIESDGKYWRLVRAVTGGRSYIGHFSDRPAAQAAAQAHADAAHWANTKLGDLK